jgi:hypothetical protein
MTAPNGKHLCPARGDVSHTSEAVSKVPEKKIIFCVYKKRNGVMVIPEGETTYCRRGPPGTTKKTKND